MRPIQETQAGRVEQRFSNFGLLVFVTGGLRCNPVFPRDARVLNPHRGSHLFSITKFAVEAWLAWTVTDFSHVLGSENMGRCTTFSVKTSSV